MAGLYTITTRAPGTLISALIYNGDHQNHVDGRTATLVQSYGTTVAQYNLTEDPFPLGVESLPTTLAGEVSRLRFDIAAIKASLSGNTPVNWWDAVVAPAFAVTGARVQRATNFAIPNNALTTVDFTGATAEFNTGVWSNSVNPTRFTAPATGKYYAAFGVVWTTEAVDGLRELHVLVNGSGTNQPAITNTYAGPPIDTPPRQSVSAVLDLGAADYVEFAALQDSGITLHLTANSNSSIIGAFVFLGS